MSAQDPGKFPVSTICAEPRGQLDLSANKGAIITKSTHANCRIIAIISVLVGALMVAGAAVAAWYFLTNQSKDNSEKVGLYYVGSLRVINQEFISEYGQNESPEFESKAADVNEQIKEALLSSDIGSYYNKSVVYTFGKGSLLTYFWVAFQVKTTKENEINSDLVKASINNLFESQESTDYQIQLESTKISNLSKYELETLISAAECHSYYFIGTTNSVRLSGPDSKYKSCFWHLQGPAGHLLKLRLEWVKDYCRDRILVYNEITVSQMNLLTSLYKCNWHEPAVEILSSSNVMSIVWKEGRYSSSQTFRFSAQALPMPECFANITLREEWGIQGNCSTPYFPSYYPPNAHCTWYFTVPSLDYGITLWFDGYELNTPLFRDPCSQGQWMVQNRKLCGQRLLQPYAERIFAVALTTKVTFSSEVTLTGPGIQFQYSLFNQSNPCPDGVFCTVSGLCVPECDGLKDCSNNADENNCVCPAQHLCTGGSSSCLSLHKVCNHVKDCDGGSDEESCNEAVPCSLFTYKCDDGSCVKKANPQCDYERDCEDGSDERNCECGLQMSKSRIVGGTNSTEGEWPWQASLQIYGQHVCGGMLINEHWVLSAAHCFPGSYAPPEFWTVYLGKFKLSTVGSNELSFKVQRIIVHPYYDGETSSNDVALLKLDQPVPLAPTICPICLPATTHVFEAGQLCWVTGWGATEEKGPVEDVLQKVDVKLVDQSVCNEAYSYSITPQMICAGYPEGKKDSCQGDSGGPLVCAESSGRWFLAGIVSFGYGCARPEYYGVYSRVTRLITWIRSVTS
ncbi:transmembrane protease serine 6 [Mobula hypostoma]|uniref:transmembrane protease serine 6 n=1 Tax=Mobula hypostoma TaxID=723540 RepID=UPI002FC31740